MRAGSLFSGVGGLDLGLARAGFEHAFFCESDPWRRSVLASHWPGVPIHEDVREIDAAAWTPRFGEGRRALGGGSDHSPLIDGARASGERDVRQIGANDLQRHRLPGGRDNSAHPGRDGRSSCPDLLCGGFPCQDLSVAGNRAGLAGDRSGLFFEFARIIDLVRPRWVLIENVPGLLSSNGGRDFGIVLESLADVGYGVAWRVLDSRFFGVPQRRRRVFILGADAGDDPRAAAERAGQILAVGTRCTGHPQARREARTDVAGALGGSVGAGRGHDGNPFDRGGLSSLSGLGSGGPDDNDAQAGRLVADTLREHPRPGSNSNGAVVTHALTSSGHDAGEDGTGRGTPLVSFDSEFSNQGNPSEHAILTRKLRRAISSLATGVRRLTPTECERLQAWPDGWTNPNGDAPDSRRYAACGDGVTASVAEWIGRRLIQAGAEEPVTPKKGDGSFAAYSP